MGDPFFLADDLKSIDRWYPYIVAIVLRDAALTAIAHANQE
jgi:hypothetical protein